jgi:hypothetical protein
VRALRKKYWLADDQQERRVCDGQKVLQAAREGDLTAANGFPARGVIGVVQTLTTLFGPGPTDVRIRTQYWKWRGAVGIAWALLAAIGPALGGRRERRLGLLLLALVAYAVGLAEVLDAAVGFRPFRFPPRVLIPAATPLALLAGCSFDAGARPRHATHPVKRGRSSPKSRCLTTE